MCSAAGLVERARPLWWAEPGSTGVERVAAGSRQPVRPSSLPVEPLHRSRQVRVGLRRRKWRQPYGETSIIQMPLAASSGSGL